MFHLVRHTNPTHTIADCIEHGWCLLVRCQCGHQKRLWPELRDFPASAKLGDFAARLKCSACGAASGDVGTYNANNQGGHRA